MNWNASKQPLATSPNRPIPDRRGRYPISIIKASFDPVVCPVFGEQIDIITASLRPTRETQKIKRTATTIYIAVIHLKLIHRYELLYQDQQNSEIYNVLATLV